MKAYDVVIIGGGPGGSRAAEILAQAGKKVCIVEKSQIGGTCLNQGCIPLKTMLHTVKIREQLIDGLKTGRFTGKAPEICLEKLEEEKDVILNDLRKGLIGRLKNMGVDIFYAYGSLVRKDMDGKFITAAGHQELQSAYLILASGSVPKRLYENRGIPAASEYVLACRELPASIAVIGAGVIGLETAAFFHALGIRVELIEKTGTIAGGMDQETANAYSRILKRKGIQILLNSSIENTSADVLLEASGRIPYYDTEMLDKNHIQYSDTGILCNEYGETSLQGCYVCGDADGMCMLAHAAYMEAEAAAAHILGKKRKKDYNYVPKVIYTNPEAAWIGLTQEQCMQQNLPYGKAVLPMTCSGRHMAENKKDGAICKLLYDRNTKQLLGAHMIGSYASEIILAIEVMMQRQMTIYEIGSLVYPHPTAGEIIGQAVQMIMEKEK